MRWDEDTVGLLVHYSLTISVEVVSQQHLDGIHAFGKVFHFMGNHQETRIPLKSPLVQTKIKMSAMSTSISIVSQ